MIEWIKNLFEPSEQIKRVAKIIRWDKAKIDIDSFCIFVYDSHLLDKIGSEERKVNIYLSKITNYTRVEVNYRTIEETYSINRTDKKYILKLINDEVNRRFNNNDE